MSQRTSPASISQAEINNIVWKACDTFRGTIDPSEYKNYILVMLFVKYVSDVWRDAREQLEQEFPNEPEEIERRISRRLRINLPPGSDFYTLYAQRSAANIGEIINIALAAIEEANREKLDRVFRNIDFNSEAALGYTSQRNERLKHLLNDFADARLDLRPSRVGNADIIGNAYENLIAAGAMDGWGKSRRALLWESFRSLKLT